MLTQFKRASNMAEALTNAAMREIKTKKVDHARITVAPELSWVTRRLALKQGGGGFVTELSGCVREGLK